MSKLIPESARCPACGLDQGVTVFFSLNGERVDHQVRQIIDGTFEQIPCSGCGATFRPEHRMLYSHFTQRTWIVMHPLADRPQHAVLERGVELVLAEQFAYAPRMVADGLAGARPRLVFGQHMLSEAVRLAEARIDPALLEGAKLFAIRRNISRLGALPPFELCYEATEPSGEQRLAIFALADLERLGDLHLPADALAEAHAAQPELQVRYPELFERPYVSATRYLFAAG
jgi:CpXC protein